MDTSSTCRDVAQCHTRGKRTRWPVIHVLSCLLFTFSVAFGEPILHGVNRTACSNEPLVLTCQTDEIVATKLYGGHHVDENTRTCSHVPGDCRASVRGLRISHWPDCLWKMSNCTIQLPHKHVFLHKPCLEQTIHYLIAEDFKCVPKNMIYIVNGSRDTKVNSSTGYVLSPGYPFTYTAEGRSRWLTIEARAGSGVLLRTVDMEVRPKVAGVCTDFVEVNCSANDTSFRYCGSAPWSISPDQCRGDVNVTFMTTRHTKLYKGFVVFFRHVSLPTTCSPETVISHGDSSSTFPVVNVVLVVLLCVAIFAVFAIAWLVVVNRRLTVTRHALTTQLRTMSSERNPPVRLMAPHQPTGETRNGTHHVMSNAQLQRDEYYLIRPAEGTP